MSKILDRLKLEREIDDVANRPSMDVSVVHAKDRNTRTPLHGHMSEASAYIVDDYPYGFRQRTKIRYWLESNPKKGWRFVSQTLIPDGVRWNKPKASTYASWGGAMYLDNEGHVDWVGVGPYSSDRDALAFVQTFPGADLRELRKVAPQKVRFLKGQLQGEIVFVVNGAEQPRSLLDINRLRKELAIWQEIESRLA